MPLLDPAVLVQAIGQGQPLPGKAGRRSLGWIPVLVDLAQQADAEGMLNRLLPDIAPVRAAEALVKLAELPEVPGAFHRLLAHLDPAPRRPEQEVALHRAVMALIRRDLRPDGALQEGRLAALSASLAQVDFHDSASALRLRLALGEALHGTSFDAVYPTVRARLPVSAHLPPLIQTVLEQARDNQRIGTTLDLLPDTPPLAGGRLLLAALLDRDEFTRLSLKDDAYRWPLPVAEALAQRLASQPDTSPSGQDWVRQGFARDMERLLVRTDLSDDLKGRLFEACRPLRPLVAEVRFQAVDRQQALAVRPPSAPRARRRS